jgi:hypothetical protein
MTGRRGGLLRQRNFRLFWTGESLSEVGNSVAVFAVPLVAIDTLHTSTFVVTLLTAMVWRDPYVRAMTAFSSLGNLALTGVDALLVVFWSVPSGCPQPRRDS